MLRAVSAPSSMAPSSNHAGYRAGSRPPRCSGPSSSAESLGAPLPHFPKHACAQRQLLLRSSFFGSREPGRCRALAERPIIPHRCNRFSDRGKVFSSPRKGRPHTGCNRDDGVLGPGIGCFDFSPPAASGNSVLTIARIANNCRLKLRWVYSERPLRATMSSSPVWSSRAQRCVRRVLPRPRPALGSPQQIRISGGLGVEPVFGELQIFACTGARAELAALARRPR